MFKQVRAVDLWRQMLTMLFETGHPWITFKDPATCARRSSTPASSTRRNLCTEITLNTSPTTRSRSATSARSTWPTHVGADGARRRHGCERTVRTAMRMLDNVIDINFYTIPEARDSNLRHRPVGLGLMGFQDALLRAAASPYASDAAVAFADDSMEAISLLRHRGLGRSGRRARRATPSFDGSLWSRGILPIDSLELLARGARRRRRRGPRQRRCDWDALRERGRSRRHAQLQRDGDRADGDDLQHRAASRSRSSRLYQQPLRQSRTCPATSPSSTSTWCAT